MSRVLIVEDEAHLAQRICASISKPKATGSRSPADGESALEPAPRSQGKRKKRNNGIRGRRAAGTKSAREFDAVVLDVMLPGKDGFAVASELRAAQNYVPVLMLTARSRPEDVLKGFASGADDYLPKPFELPIWWLGSRGCLAAASGCGSARRLPPMPSRSTSAP